MNTQRAAVALRQTIVRAVTTPHDDSLVGVATDLLPNGAEAFVYEGKSTYRLDKAAVPTDADVAPSRIVPSAGPGVWVLQSQSAAGWVEAYGTGDFSEAVIDTDQNIWRVLPSGTDYFDMDAGSDVWELNTTTGVFTYTGTEVAAYEINASAACYSVGEGGGNLVDLTVSQNGSFLGVSTDDFLSTQTLAGAGQNAVQVLSLSRIVVVEPDDEIQHVVRCVTSGDSIGFARYVATITAV